MKKRTATMTKKMIVIEKMAMAMAIMGQSVVDWVVMEGGDFRG